MDRSSSPPSARAADAPHGESTPAGPSAALPRGGGALKGLGEQFSTNPFTGTASLSIPLPAPEARGAGPGLSLNYNSGEGMGAFGMGFALSLPWIGLRTDRVRPRHDGGDDYFLTGMDVLTERRITRNGAEEVDDFQARLDGREYRVRRYIPRVEGTFARIERWSARGDIHWRVTDRDNHLYIYGRTDEARVRPEKYPERVFRWYLQESRDALGNRIVYEYKREDRAGVMGEEDRETGAAVHLKRVKYGNYGDDEWAFEIVFDYGEHDPVHEPEETRPWSKRADSHSDFTAGYEVRVHRLCRNVLVFHHLPNARGEMTKRLVNRLKLEYDESPVRTLLKKARRIGYRLRDDGYQSADLPPLELDYTPFEPRLGEYKDLKTLTERFVPGVPDGDSFRFLDLDGEGLPGMLHTRDRSVLYWAPRGEGRLDEARSLFEFPAERNGEHVEYSLSDLENSGRMNLVVTGPERNGFYEIEPDGSWKTYRAFRRTVIPDRKLLSDQVDLTGDGFPDLLTYRESDILVNRSLGKVGFAATETLARRRDFPAGNYAWRKELTTYADVFGDGLSHRVRIRSGTVEVWPNLGYGRFGEVIQLKNAPRFEGDFNASRLRLGDVDGTGTADIIYMHADHFTVYFNRAGNGYGPGEDFPLPEGFDDFDRVDIADIEGTGTACLVLSRNKPRIRHVYFDFARGRKPYLLDCIDNHMGARTRLEYKPSTYFYLKDREAGRPWITRLPFPVQVVEKTETRDALSGTRLVNRFAYRHGYYDPFYREFRGFALVEKWDAETLEEKRVARNGKDEAIAFDLHPDELHAVPILTRTWHHTGAFPHGDSLAGRLAGEYYQGDERAPPEGAGELVGEIEKVGPENLFWAYRALGGRVLREEVYGESEHPYTVTRSRFSVRLIQEDRGDAPPVFSVLPAETVSLSYERNPADPRMEQEVLLESDEFDLPLKNLKVFYGRRPGTNRSREQQFVRALLSTTRYAHETRDFYRLGMVLENAGMEITGLSPHDDGSRLLDMETLRERVDEAMGDVLPYEEHRDPATNIPGARLVELTRNYYRRDDGDEAAPRDRATALGLPHHAETTVMTPALVRKAFEERVTDAVLREGGYLFADGLWWRSSGITYYDERHFFQPARSVDPFGAETRMEYDAFSLTTIAVTDAVGLTTRMVPDYDALGPREVLDPNAIRHRALYDPLGRVVMTAIADTEDGAILRGDELPSRGSPRNLDINAGLENPRDALMNAGELFIHDDHAYTREGSPARTLRIQRRVFAVENRGTPESTGDSADEEPLLEITYSDGFGRLLQSKLLTDPGEAFARDEGEKLVRRFAGRRWRVTGRTVFDNKGRPVKQYEPFFSASVDYEDEVELREYGITPIMFYDPPGRVFRVETPKGFVTRVEFDSWARTTFDENDLILEAPYYLENRANTAPEFADELDALNKTLPHANTPNTSETDNVGNIIRATEILEDGSRLITTSRPDIQGHVLETADPRLSEAPGAANFRTVYSMTGEALLTDGVDNGARRELKNVLGNTIHAWDQAGYHVNTGYDLLQRPITRFVRHAGDGLNQFVERITYGDEIEDRALAIRGNLLGKPAIHRHQAGVDYLDACSIGGNPEKTRRRLRREYKQEANWNDPDGEALEPESWETVNHYNALEWTVHLRVPDGSITRPGHNPVGLLKKLTVERPGESETTFIEGVEYDAKNQRQSIQYGNGTRTEYEYEAATFRLFGVRTLRPGASGEILQDISYTYDPVGNITRTRDNSHKRVFNAGSIIDPLLDYHYDSIYRLTRASGREHPGLAGTERKNLRARDPKHAARVPGLNDGTSLAPYTREYEYDHAGNLLNMRHRAANTSASWSRAFSVAPDSNRAFETENLRGRSLDELYDAKGNILGLDHLSALRWNYRDNIQAAEIINRAAEAAAPDAEYYVYDASGNRTRRVRERLIKRGDTRMEFEYDSDGNRTGKSVVHREPDVLEIDEKLYLGGIEIKRIRRERTNESKTILERRTLHVMDGEHRLALIHHWTINETQRERPEGEKQTRYQYGNHQGSASLELDESGLVISYEEYFPYGGTSLTAGRNRLEVDLKEYRYSAKERDDATGLYYYGARYYAPWFFRWLSPDPAGTVDGPNLYAFVRGNPVKFIDENGHYARYLWALRMFLNYRVRAGDAYDHTVAMRQFRIGMAVGLMYDLRELRFWRGRQAIALAQWHATRYVLRRRPDHPDRDQLGDFARGRLRAARTFQDRIDEIGFDTPHMNYDPAFRAQLATSNTNLPEMVTAAIPLFGGRYAIGTSHTGRAARSGLTLPAAHRYRPQHPRYVPQLRAPYNIHAEPNAMAGLEQTAGPLPMNPRNMILATVRTTTRDEVNACYDCRREFPAVPSVTDAHYAAAFAPHLSGSFLARRASINDRFEAILGGLIRMIMGLQQQVQALQAALAAHSSGGDSGPPDPMDDSKTRKRKR